MAALPEPQPGLVIRYAYLWSHEAARGQEEARKDRPCVVVLSVQDAGNDKVVTVAPITHTRPERADLAIPLPSAVKRRLGLDSEPSWIIAAELNRFLWPGVDLRPTAVDQRTYAYGLLPAALYHQLRLRVLALARAGQTALTRRTE